MSYSTRRSGGFGQQPQQNVGNIGQRRPVVTNNFVPGGQLKTQQAKQTPTTPQARLQPQQQQQQPAGGVQFKSQQPPQQPAVKLPQQQVQQQQVQPQQQQQPIQKQEPIIDETNGDPMETGEIKKKPFWAKGEGGKITRRERVRRRNVRLSKMLQPKNAVMILNELVKNTSYMVEELPVKFDDNQFKATVLYEGVEHIGYGRSKIQAKNTAAETALKHYVKTNKLTDIKKDEEGNEKMDVSEDIANQSPLPWQHVASFALYKLFCSWGEDPNIVKNQSQSLATGDKLHENKPAKKLPENPETINPLMLINQMLPHAQFEEIGKTGNPPTVTFSFRCNVEDQSFVGTGPNKKAAKKMAAFGACHKILEITYSPDVYVPSY